MTTRSINFRFANELNYNGLNEDQKKPSYYVGGINYGELFDFLAQRGPQLYQCSDFHDDRFGTPPPGTDFEVVAIGKPNVKIDGKNVQMDVRADLNQQDGEVNLSSKFKFRFEVNPKKEIDRYQLKVPYAGIENPCKPAHYAIVLNSNDFNHFVEILTRVHKEFSQELEDYIFEQFEIAFGLYRGINHIDFLYEQAPLWVISRLGVVRPYLDMQRLLKGLVDERGSNEELAIIKIIKSYSHSPSAAKGAALSPIELFQRTEFLLAASLQRSSNGQTTFALLYEKMNNYGGADNFNEFIYHYFFYWKISTYPGQDYGQGADALTLDYKSNKAWGFYTTNMDFHFKGELINVVSGEDRALIDFARLATFISLGSIKFRANVDNYLLHLYQPIQLVELNPDGDIQIPDKYVPAFMLKALDDNNEWFNFGKAVEVIIELVTTLSGIGNLAKLRHLAKGMSALNKFVRISVAGIEVISGTTSLMLAFVDECDENSNASAEERSFCNKLRTFLIYLDLASLGVDAITSKLLRNSADEALGAMPPHLREEQPTIFYELRRVKNGERVGTGGSFKYITKKASTRMVGQEQPMSCAAACIRQIAKENGVELSEKVARDVAKTDGTTFGTILDNIGPAIEELLSGKAVKIKHGGTQLLPRLDYGQMAQLYSKIARESSLPSNSWIASLKPPGKPRHTILVEKIEDGTVHVRDPWGEGAGYGVEHGVEATIKLEDFVDFWKGSYFHFVLLY